MRDDFEEKTIRTLEKRVNSRCSNPWCGRPTSGPGTSPDKAVNVGVAAHITAASPKGPRFDPSLTADQRGSIDNGIWLCSTCSILIDRDETRYTVQVLRGWRRIAEEVAERRLSRPDYAAVTGEPWAFLDGFRTSPNLANVISVRGGRTLRGSVRIAGAKNAVTKQIVAALLSEDPCFLSDVPPLLDVLTLVHMIRNLGGKAQAGEAGLYLDTKSISVDRLQGLQAFHDQSRLSILLLAPLLHRFGKAVIPRQGGCNLGTREIDFHLNTVRQMGADLHREGQAIVASAPHGLKGTEVRFPTVSVGATEQAILAGVLADGLTIIQNAAVEPEILDLVRMLNEQMGANIVVRPSREIVIKGVRHLTGYRWTPIPDRSEAGSWASLALAGGGPIVVQNVREEDLVGFRDLFVLAGGTVGASPDGLTFGRRSDLPTPVAIQTGAYPGFLTDWQPPLVAALTQASGRSLVHETVFNDRLNYVPSLEKLGARIDLHKECLGTVACHFAPDRSEKALRHSAIVHGPSTLSGTDVRIDELRGGFACLIAALIASGETTIRNFSFLQKGYDSLFHKLLAIGADVTPVEWHSSV